MLSGDYKIHFLLLVW